MLKQETVNTIARETLKYMVENKIPVSPDNYEKWFNVFKEAIYYEVPLTNSNLKELYKQKYIKNNNDIKTSEKISKKYVYKVLDEIDTSLLELINKIEKKEKEIREEKNIVKHSEDKEVILNFVDNIAEEFIDIKDDLQKERDLIEEAKGKVTTTKNKLILNIPGLYDSFQFEKDLKSFLKYPEVKFNILYLYVNKIDKIIERYGVGAGNVILKRLGDILQKHLPENTPIYYLGNGEYAILLKNFNKEGATEIAFKLYNIIQNKNFKYESNVFRINSILAVVEREKNDTYNSFLSKIQKCIERGKNSDIKVVTG